MRTFGKFRALLASRSIPKAKLDYPRVFIGCVVRGVLIGLRRHWLGTTILIGFVDALDFRDSREYWLFQFTPIGAVHRPGHPVACLAVMLCAGGDYVSDPDLIRARLRCENRINTLKYTCRETALLFLRRESGLGVTGISGTKSHLLAPNHPAYTPWNLWMPDSDENYCNETMDTMVEAK